MDEPKNRPPDRAHLGDAAEEASLLERALTRAKKDASEGKLTPPFRSNASNRRPLHPKERIFLARYLDQDAETYMKADLAAEAAGWSPDYGYKLIRMGHIQSAISARLQTPLKRAGVNLSMERLMKELDWGIRKARASITRKETAYGKCPKCNTDVPVEIAADPRSVGTLIMALAKIVQFAAKMMGYGQTPARDRGRPGGGVMYNVGGWEEVYKLAVDRPDVFTDAQRADLAASARAERAAIDRFLTLVGGTAN